MKREIKKAPACAHLFGSQDIGSDAKQWLLGQAGKHRFKWLLAHADDGVIWGRWNNENLLTSDTVDPSGGISPLFRKETLWQARLFDSLGELFLWCDGDGCWKARLIRDVVSNETPDWHEAIDEYHMLWGTVAYSLDDGFTLMSDGVQGLRHIVPLKVSTNPDENVRPLRLGVRHYLEKSKRDGDKGYTRIVVSRLFKLTTKECF
jgi:CRISPR-associated protein (TIGR03984 family)